MKLCLTCGACFSSLGWNCPECHSAPANVRGFPAFAPDLAANNDGFREGYFEELRQREEQSFWFVARNKLIVMALRRQFPTARSLLEVGCGTGFVLAAIESALPDMRLAGSEVFSVGLGHAAARVRRADLFQMDARRMPFVEEFDVVAAFDVLEHIDEDLEALKQMHRTATKGGGILLTVPQHPSLWSGVDEYACHRRRYTRTELCSKVETAGFDIVNVTSFVSLLLPLMYVSRWKKMGSASAELQIGRLANAVLGGVMNVERAIIGAGLSLPAGGSLLLAARKH
jgi:SAM-dependent methyltransferase